MESTTSTEDCDRSTCVSVDLLRSSVTNVPPDRDRTVVAVDHVASDTVVKANGERGDSEARVVRTDTDTCIDGSRTLVEYFLSVSDADATYDSEDSKKYFLEH